jgi:hypothetical protein
MTTFFDRWPEGGSKKRQKIPSTLLDAHQLVKAIQ